MNQDSLNQIFGPINLIITLYFFPHIRQTNSVTPKYDNGLFSPPPSLIFFQPVCCIIRAISLLSSHSDSTTFPHALVKGSVM
jgi:hypothetical protein